MADTVEAFTTPPHTKGAMSVDEFCGWAGLGRRKFYDEAKAGRIVVRKIGRRSVVTMQDGQAYLASLPVAPLAREAA